MKKVSIGQIACALILGFAGSAIAAEPAQVSLKGDVMIEKTVVENGSSKVVLAEPKVVVPGDRLLFTTRYANGGTAAVQNFVVTNPLPAAVVLTPESAAALSVSVDGGKSFAKLAAQTVADAHGGRRPAQAADVTHVRWTVPAIAAGAQGKVEYHAIVR